MLSNEDIQKLVDNMHGQNISPEAGKSSNTMAKYTLENQCALGQLLVELIVEVRAMNDFES